MLVDVILFVIAVIIFSLYYFNQKDLAQKGVLLFLEILFFIVYFKIIVYVLEYALQPVPNPYASIITIFIVLIVVVPATFISAKKVIEIIKAT
ncbi:hypothetical protein ACLIA0_10330 [Bacillaceae bacterium W0354]